MEPDIHAHCAYPHPTWYGRHFNRGVLIREFWLMRWCRGKGSWAIALWMN